MHDIIIPNTITNEEDFESAKELITKLKSDLKIIEAKKETVSRPLLDAIAARRAEFAPLLKKYDGAIVSLTKMLTEYQTAKMRQLEASREAIVNTNDDITAITKLSELEEVDKSGFRKHQILLISDESLIPREYLLIDEKKVLDDLKTGKIIPGAKIEIQYIPSGR